MRSQGMSSGEAFGVPAMPVAQPGHCALIWRGPFGRPGRTVLIETEREREPASLLKDIRTEGGSWKTIVAARHRFASCFQVGSIAGEHELHAEGRSSTVSRAAEEGGTNRSCTPLDGVRQPIPY